MSGQPRKNASDDTKFRNAYLANLNARSKLDAFELQSSRNLERTGQPTAEMTDTRNLTEIFADTEQLKIAVRSGLLQITDGANAQIIVNNLAPEQLQLVAGRIDTIVKDIKPAYKLGIPAEIFLQYVNRLEDDLQRNQGISDGLQQVSGKELLLTLRDIKQSLVDKEQLRDELIRLNEANIFQLNGLFARLTDALPSIDEVATAVRLGKDAVVTELMEELPTRTELKLAVDTVIERQASPVAFGQALSDLQDLLAMNQEQLDMLDELRAGGGGGRPAFTFKTLEEIGRLKRVAYLPYVNKMVQAYPQLIPIVENAFTVNASGEVTGIKPAFSKLADIQAWFLANNDRLKTAVEGVAIASPVKGTPVAQPVGKAEAEGKGMKGCGVARQRPPRSKPTIAFDLGVKEDEKYLPIGRYLISKRQLDKDIVAIKTKTGASLNGMPSQRVSSHFAKAMRNIIGGSAPSYDEITGMSDEERHYLHKIANTTRIADRLKIPAPDKTKDEQDINRFNVLRGQVSAGQDSREAIKELKLLIIKLKNKDLLPSRQAKDILYELTELGY